MRRQFVFPMMDHQPFFCFPESVGHYKDETDHWVYRPAGTLNNFNIHYVASGKGFVEIDGQSYMLQRGDAVLYFPLQQQTYYTSGEEPWDIRWVHFYGHQLQEFLTVHRLHRSKLWTLRQPAAWERAHMALLDEAVEHRLLYPTTLSMLTYAVIMEFIQQAEPLSSGKRNHAAERIAELLPLLQNEACAPFILEEWAERAGISPHYFCRLFRKIMHMTPMDFVTLCRMQKAKQWLIERTESTIRDIAADAGYPNTSYFNKRFLETEGMRPSEYRTLFGK
ncbi:AraC-type DNA-binding protein [Paenibacillus sp. UNCCL117]|uniref:helix-turn-helix transcriptional regulator n=1 Tax=unclassified Paenibacillus TaxID=185978 RepID=UPI0008837818|nr:MULTISPECIES: AraC family transcriptional regulator [unclassified Paenibacillus]SDD76008.1 AraC-type DNA-binding protein [Paenibacillus sp. cl123]SFW52322.1 AraC-type DNA-binding protein [Paenibacillus sp. UNCCL117]